ncbi:MAG: class I SAM-dependent methyltransferase [Calditrichaeota bacterium]|nr:MAG: class I SAM-dependent methyltransferase [Calditrichota bacterium]
MILNKAEFLVVNNPLRDFIQEKYEIPILRKMIPADVQFETALEIGCGTGQGSGLIKKYFAPVKIEAIDLDDRMIGLAQKRNHDHAINYSQMDAAKLEFPDDHFDIIFDFAIIHHIPNWQDCIHELARTAKDGAFLLLEELSIESFSGIPGGLWKKILDHPYEKMFDFQELEDFLEATGFQILQTKYSNPLGLLKHISLAAKLKKTGV